MIRYLNWRGETLDELDSKDFDTRDEFIKEQSRLGAEYALAGMSGCYWSPELYE